MKIDKRKFISLKGIKGVNITHGDNTSTKIMGKGILNVNIEKDKAQDILLVEGLKNNFLCVSQMVDKGDEVTFYSNSCK